MDRFYGRATRDIDTRLPWEGGEPKLIPKGHQLCVTPADNMPEGHRIKWFIVPSGDDDEWDRVALTYGIGLENGDIELFGDRPLLFPQYTDFKEVFTKWIRSGKEETLPAHLWKNSEGRVVRIGPMISISGGRGYCYGYVQPTEEVLNRIKLMMFHLSDIHFKAIFRDDETQVLISATYDQIIGSRWIAIVRPDTVPEELLP